MAKEDPWVYESTFSLILSLQEQLNYTKDNKFETAESISDKFNRLAKLTIGELEFARRMGFEGFPCIRLSPYPVLWRDFNQPTPMDFLIILDDKKYCVDVKFYDWKKLGDKLIIQKTKINSIGKFRDYHKFDGALLAIKRFERWYLFDIVKFKQIAQEILGNLEAKFSELHKIDILKEKFLIFNTGALKKIAPYKAPEDISTSGGVYFKKISIHREKNSIKIPFSTDSKTEGSDIYKYDNIQARVLTRIYDRLCANMNLLYKEFGNYSKVDNFTDCLPTRFTVSDEITEINSIQELNECCLNNFTKLKLIFCEKGKKLQYYFTRIFGIVTKKQRDIDKTKWEETFS